MEGRSDRKRRRNYSDSNSEDSSKDSSGSDTSEEKTKRRKKIKDRKHKDKKQKHKTERKKKKNAKKKHKKVHLGAVDQSNYGKYGLLTEVDIASKQPEFFLWLSEEKQIDPEVQPRFVLKKLFDDYREDYNTATLAHKKYYNLEAYEAAKRQKGKKKVKDKVATNDEEEHRRVQKVAHKVTPSLPDLSEMQRITRERAEEDYKKRAGLKADETRGIRYHVIPQ